GAYFYVARAGEKRLRAAIALADRLDPGWRLEEIEAKRQVISDDENSARKIILAVRVMEAHVRPSTWASQNPWFTELRSQTPELQLTERQHALLRADLAKLPDVLAEARKLADMPRGRFPISYSPNALSTVLPNVQDSRYVGFLLMMDVMCKVHENDVA